MSRRTHCPIPEVNLFDIVYTQVNSYIHWPLLYRRRTSGVNKLLLDDWPICTNKRIEYISRGYDKMVETRVSEETLNKQLSWAKAVKFRSKMAILPSV